MAGGPTGGSPRVRQAPSSRAPTATHVRHWAAIETSGEERVKQRDDLRKWAGSLRFASLVAGLFLVVGGAAPASGAAPLTLDLAG
jgi:hypothetical protein